MSLWINTTIQNLRLSPKDISATLSLIQVGCGKREKILYQPLCIFGIVVIWNIVLMMKRSFKRSFLRCYKVTYYD